MQSTVGILAESDTLTRVAKSEISKKLFSEIRWDELVQSDFLRRRDYQVLENSHSNFEVVLDNPAEAKELARILLKIADSSSNPRMLQYVYTRIEEILGLTSEFDNIDAFGLKHCKMFSTDGTHLSSDECFKKALLAADVNVQRSAALCYACLLTVFSATNAGRLLEWIVSKLVNTGEGVWETALPALHMLTRSDVARREMLQAGLVGHAVQIMRSLGVNGNTQHLYELSFALWAMSLGKSELNAEEHQHAFLSSGSIRVLVDLIAAAPTRKIVRMCLATLRNLAQNETDIILNEMLTAGLLRLIETMSHNNFPTQVGDEEVEQDFKFIHEVLVRNYRDLSSFERWASEVQSGALRWGILHKEKFWRENARFVEADNFKLLKALIELLRSPDPTIVCVALYDIGEFTRFYPNGRVVVSRLGAKDQVMEMMTAENTEVQKHTLQCISKIMVTNWEFLR